MADRLMNKGWKPKLYTPDGRPKVDETVLSSLEYPEAKLLAEHFLVQKRIGQLAEGANAWLKLERTEKFMDKLLLACKHWEVHSPKA